MSASKGSNRRRIAGDAARRRRELTAEEAASTPTTAGDIVAEEEASAPTETTADPEAAAETPRAEYAEVEDAPSDGEPAERDEPSESGGPSEPARERTPLRLHAPPRETWWWLAILGVITVAALVFVAVVGVRYLGERNDDAALADARTEATSAATAAAETILSYDYQSLDADRAAAEKLMTDDFRAQYGQLFTQDYCDAFPVEGECTVEGKFPDVVEENQQQVTAAVVDAAAMECGDDCKGGEARVLMFIDQSSTVGGDQQAPAGQRAIFTMVEQGGDWLVDGIAYV